MCRNNNIKINTTLSFPEVYAKTSDLYTLGKGDFSSQISNCSGLIEDATLSTLYHLNPQSWFAFLFVSSFNGKAYCSSAEMINHQYREITNIGKDNWLYLEDSRKNKRCINA